MQAVAAPRGLVIDGLTVSYPGAVSPAIDRLSLDVAEGSFHAVLGPSGCGKTTLLKGLVGLVPCDRGRFRLPGDGTTAYVPQGNSCFPWMRVDENVAYGLKVRGEAKDRRLARARQLLGDLGLGAYSRYYPAHLSEGMRQRVAIARAFAVEAALLVMDEPLSALDFQTKIAVQAELLGLWERRRCTVLYVTHDIDEALALADCVSVLSSRPGRVLATVEVPFSRPRRYDLVREHPAYAATFRQLYGLLEPQ